MAKKKKSKPTLIRGTYHLSMAGVETDDIRSLILRRRLQILIHSYIYYELDKNIVSDSTWSKWANELVELQNKYPLIAERVDYHKEFMDFDGSTGFDLPLRNPEISKKALAILEIYERSNTREKSFGQRTNRAVHKSDAVRLFFPSTKNSRSGGKSL